MTWAEFCQWVWERHGHRLEYTATGAVWRVIWQRRGARLGSGHPAVYTAVHQRRYSTWIRLRDLVTHDNQHPWIDASESHDDGWLINTGDGIRWISHDDLLAQAPGIAARGLPLVGIRCGI